MIKRSVTFFLKSSFPMMLVQVMFLFFFPPKEKAGRGGAEGEGISQAGGISHTLKS